MRGICTPVATAFGGSSLLSSGDMRLRFGAAFGEASPIPKMRRRRIVPCDRRSVAQCAGTCKIRNRTMKKQAQQQAIDIAAVQSRMLTIRNQQVLLDRDVAALYGVETKALNQAVKRNAEKFPEGYILKMTDDECSRSQIVTLNGSRRESKGRSLLI